MTETPLHYRTITELAGDIKSGALSPVALTEHLVARLERLNGPLHAFNLLTVERALDVAKAAEAQIAAGTYLGPLHGIPYAVKDLYDVAGLPTTAGSATMADNIADADSRVTQRLAEAGMIALGKTITVEFARGIVGINHIQGTPHNPWHQTHHVPGGSSAGTAVAVAAGMAPMGLGSDTGGSVRAPAGLCGVVGLKTTVGRISRHGVFPLSWTLDSVGPLVRSTEDAAIVYQLLQGEDAADPSTIGIRPEDVMASLHAGAKGLRVGIPQDAFYADLDPEVEAAMQAAADIFRDLGAQVENVPFPEATTARSTGMTVIGVEACVIHEERIKTMADQMDPVVGPRLVADLALTGVDYAKALQELAALRESQKETLRDVDVLLTPTTPIPALPVEVVDETLESYLAYAQKYLANTSIGNKLDLCGLSLPCGFTEKGLPIGLLLNAKPFDEALVLRAGQAYEQATDWRSRHPDLSWTD